MMNDASKRYLVVTVIINFVFYTTALLTVLLEVKQKSQFLDDLFLISILFILNTVGFFVGWKMLKESPKDKYVRLGLIINASAFLALMVYSFILYPL